MLARLCRRSAYADEPQTMGDTTTGFSSPVTAERVTRSRIAKTRDSLRFTSEVRHDRGLTGIVGRAISVAGLEQANSMDAGK